MKHYFGDKNDMRFWFKIRIVPDDVIMSVSKCDSIKGRTNDYMEATADKESLDQIK